MVVFRNDCKAIKAFIINDRMKFDELNLSTTKNYRTKQVQVIQGTVLNKQTQKLKKIIDKSKN